MTLKRLKESGLYLANEKGEIFSNHSGKLKPMKQTLKPNGYLKFNASLKFDKFTVNSHRFIWFYLKGEIPKNKCINHKNFIRSDNRIENLELLTLQENMAYSAERGRLNKPKNKGEKNSKAKLNKKKVLEIFYSKEPIRDICEKYKVGRTSVNYIKQKKAWKHLWVEGQQG